MKILMIANVPFLTLRGTPLGIKSRLEDLSKLDHEIDVVTYHVGEDIYIPGVKILRIVNLPFIKEVPVGPSSKKIFLNILVFFKALHLLLFNKYDLIHTHEEASYFGAVFSRIFRTRHLYDFHSSIPQAMKNFGYERYRPAIYLLEQLEKKVVDTSHGLITFSTDLQEHIKNLSNRTPSVIIENFQDYDFYSVDKKRLKAFKRSHPEFEDRKIILYTGTLEYYQGLDLLIESADLALKERGELEFILVGGSQSQIDNLKNTVEKRDIGSHFRFTGNLQLEEVALYMKIATILISTRSIGNNPPIKIYDYLRAGKPIVATNILAHTQILNKDIAKLVDPNPEYISEAIISLIDNPTYADSLGKKSKEFFETNYSSQEKINKTMKILDTIMQESI